MEEDKLDEIGVIESRHRRERKELQARIQALKKAAKNDKTKKKELSTEIVRLESQLENKHKAEIESFEQHQVGTNDRVGLLEPAAEESVLPKLSKAQRRRDKKSQQEKERDNQIKLQIKENLHGPRNLEIQTITEKLRERKLKIFPIPSDGDCLYKAVSHQLEMKIQKQLSVADLRSNVANYIRQNKEDFIPFMSNPKTCDMLTETEFEEYCNNIRDTNVWGGQLEIRALSNSLKCPITVIQATGPESIEQGLEYGGPPLIITYHRHMFGLGEHYNSTLCDGDNAVEH